MFRRKRTSPAPPSPAPLTEPRPLKPRGHEGLRHLELRAAALRAVSTLVPILPLVGSPKRGYRPGETLRLRGRRDEIALAAEAVADLHRIAQGKRRAPQPTHPNPMQGQSRGG